MNKLPTTFSSEQIAKTDQEVKSMNQIAQKHEMTILFQYKLMQLYGPLLGMYSIPRINNCEVWDSIVFIRTGFYKDGKFRFILKFPSNFPQTPPEIYFQSEVYHPLIILQTGQVDVKKLLGQHWNPNEDNTMYNIFNKLHKMFTDKNLLFTFDSFNPQAAKVLQQKTHFFIEKALASVQLSQQKLYQNDIESSLTIKNYSKQQIDPIKISLAKICDQPHPISQKVNQFLKFIVQS